MNFSWTPSQEAVRKHAIDVARRLNDSTLQSRDKEAIFSKRLWEVLCEEDMHMLPAPTTVGGKAYRALDLVVALESLGEHCEDTGLVFALAAHLCACIHPIAAYGTEKQHTVWLGPIGERGLIGAHAITEVVAGSDVNAMKASAIREGGGYRLNGKKQYITNAPVCDFILVHVRTGSSGSFLDYSTFILDSHAEGVRISETPHEKTGLRTTAMGEIAFNNVFVCADDRIGDEGSGGPIFQSSMEWERTCLFAMYLGVMLRQLRMTCERAADRVQFGQPIFNHQAVSHRIADMKVRLEAAKLAIYKAAWAIDAGLPSATHSSIAKLLVSESAIQNGLDALHIHGAAGIICGDIERQLRSALPSTLFSGTTDVLKNQIAHDLHKQAKRRTQEVL